MVPFIQVLIAWHIFFNFSLFSLNHKILKSPALPLTPTVEEKERKEFKKNKKVTADIELINKKNLTLCFSGLAIAFSIIS